MTESEEDVNKSTPRRKAVPNEENNSSLLASYRNAVTSFGLERIFAGRSIEKFSGLLR